jgi:hypothetical protein
MLQKLAPADASEVDSRSAMGGCDVFFSAGLAPDLSAVKSKAVSISNRT